MGPLADACARLGGWLRARPHRLTVVNALLLTAILGLLGNADLFRFVGGAAVALCAAVFVARCGRRTWRRRGDLHPYDLVVLWAPNLIAAALAAAAISLVVANPPGSFAHTLGIVLFAVEFALLTLGATDTGAREEWTGGRA